MLVIEKNPDVLITGCGPAGMAAAITIKDINPKINISIVDSGRIAAKRICQ